MKKLIVQEVGGNIAQIMLSRRKIYLHFGVEVGAKMSDSGEEKQKQKTESQQHGIMMPGGSDFQNVVIPHMGGGE